MGSEDVASAAGGCKEVWDRAAERSNELETGGYEERGGEAGLDRRGGITVTGLVHIR